MSEQRVRPTRPSAEDPGALAKKFTGTESRLSMRVEGESLYGINVAAALANMTVKRFVLQAVREKGAMIAARDLPDSDDER